MDAKFVEQPLHIVVKHGNNASAHVMRVVVVVLLIVELVATMGLVLQEHTPVVVLWVVGRV